MENNSTTKWQKCLSSCFSVILFQNYMFEQVIYAHLLWISIRICWPCVMIELFRSVVHQRVRDGGRQEDTFLHQEKFCWTRQKKPICQWVFSSMHYHLKSQRSVKPTLGEFNCIFIAGETVGTSDRTQAVKPWKWLSRAFSERVFWLIEAGKAGW